MKISQCEHFPKHPKGPKAHSCDGGDGSRFGLRVCLTCGYVGCCESDPGQHALKHSKASGHQVIASYPFDKDSFIWCYQHDAYLERDETV